MIANPKTIRRQLREQRDALVKRIEGESEKVSHTTDNNPDPGDRALQETTQMRRLALIAQARWQVEQIEICLQRIKAHAYGVCLECGNAIDPERLTVLPYATLCVSCQSKHDQVRRN